MCIEAREFRTPARSFTPKHMQAQYAMGENVFDFTDSRWFQYRQPHAFAEPAYDSSDRWFSFNQVVAR